MYRKNYPHLKRITVFTSLLFLAVMSVHSAEPTTPVNNIENKAIVHQEQDVHRLVKEAEQYIKKHGKEKAIAEFNKKDGSFTKETAYIFVLDYKGNLLANAHELEMIGQNRFDLQDVEGVYVIRTIIDKAKIGGGWVQYHWKNPVTQQMECKKSFIESMGNDYLIGSGYYYAPNANGKCE